MSDVYEAKKTPNPYTPKNNKEDDLKNRLESTIIADSFGLTPDFFDKYKNTFDDVRKSVNHIISSYGFKDKSKSAITNPLQDFKTILYNTIDKTKYKKDLFDQSVSNLSSGMRSISFQDSTNSLETQIVDGFYKISHDTFTLMKEYRTAVSLIPELKRVLHLVVRDILNANEITKRAIKNVYQVEDNLNYNISTEDIEKINDIIDKNITERYKIEEKLHGWVYNAITTCSQPLLVLPYKDILKQALILSSKTKMDNKFGGESLDSMSVEDLESQVFTKEYVNYHEFSKSVKNKMLQPKLQPFNKYNTNYEDDKGIESILNSKFDEFVGEETIDELFALGKEELYTALKVESAALKESTHLVNGVESADEEIMKKLDGIKETIHKLEGGDTTETSEAVDYRKNEEKVKEYIKKGLKMFVGAIDNNIDIVKNEYSGFSLSKDILDSNHKYKEYNKKNVVDGMYFKNIEQIEEITENFDKKVILLELDPEYVIPITVGNEHVGYYIFEHDAYSGPEASKSRRTTSFTELVKATGYGSDENVINTTSGVTVTPYDPQLSSVFSPVGIAAAASTMSMNNEGENSERVEILKRVILKTLSHRMNDPSLIDSKCFQDAMINLIREGYIINRKVQFTFVPATNMVYLAHDLDERGMPHSILDGTLLQIYMYLAGIISGIMSIVSSASDKEKLSVNIGMSEQASMSITEIQKNLSTRNVHVKSFFDNIGSVLRNTATYMRMVIPVLDGEKLYDVEQMDNSSRSPIEKEFIDDRLNSILSSIPAPPAFVSGLNEAEFSRSYLNQNIEYRNSVIEKQGPIGRCLTKLYRLIAIYMGIKIPKNNEEMENQSVTASNKTSDQEIDIKNIKIELSPPMYLNLTTIAESFTNVEPVIEAFVKYRYGEQIEGEIMTQKVQKAKQELVKKFAPNIDYDTMEKILDKIDDEWDKNLLTNKKEKLTTKGLDEEEESSGF
jgi:hypothetical protein